MLAWAVLIVWLLSIAIGEFRFTRMLRRRVRLYSADRRSSYLNSEPLDDLFTDGTRFDTREQPIGFRFHEDALDTEETGAVFHIHERYSE
jgi:hypothetical protein